MAGGKDLGKALEDFKREIRAELRSFKQSVDYCSETCDSVNALASEIKALREELVSVQKSNEKLAAENKQLQIKMEELELYSRANKGEGEPLDTVQKICEAVGEPVSCEDIDICHRVGANKPGVKNIVVRSVRRDKRTSVLVKAKKARLSTAALGFRTTDPIYVNEHLTRQGKQLLGAAIAKKREVGWKSVWTYGGKIFAKKSETSDMLKIACREDLDKIFC